VKRRNFLALAGVATGTALSVRRAEAAPAGPAAEARGVLVDLTACIGCRTCEAVCAEAHHLPDPDPDIDLEKVGPRKTSESQWTVVSRYDTSKGEVFVKTQCMHCVTPACSAGCLTKALTKQPSGPVTWESGKCMGCRYCMLSCPFEMPKAEYDSWNPKIQKCQFCFDKVKDGGQPVCVENCPGNALTFGKRDELLEIARERIYKNPGKYVSQIYGEHEVGGTSWLYLSPVPFEEVGFPTHLGSTALPEATRDFLTAVPVVLIAWPAMLLAMREATAHKEEEEFEAPAIAPVPSLAPVPVTIRGKEVE